MKRCITLLACTLTIVTSASAQHFELSLDRTASAGSFNLTTANELYAPRRPTTIDRAVRAIEQQIEEKRAAEAARSPLQPFWEAKFWSSPLMKLIPIPMGPQRLVEDPFVMPAYLTVSERQSDYQLRISDKRADILLGR
ncbi:MAG: hypothetical protein DLM73_00595 [Chthoniobacterales bacterium]|nr:MAG: hypothetical protein DLM73_00595 [Chthoniobacterales bacterium]